MKDSDPFNSIIEFYDKDHTATCLPSSFAEDITALKNHLDRLIDTHNPTLTDTTDLSVLKACQILRQALTLHQSIQLFTAGKN